jgi:hypothetical protein
VPPLVTVIEGVVSPVDHNNVPEAVVFNTELPQLFTTLNVGVAGKVSGAAVPDPVALVQPETVVVTVYVFPLLTVIEEVVSPVDQSKFPVDEVDKIELPQLSTTATTGAEGVEFGAATPDPGELVQPATV